MGLKERYFKNKEKLLSDNNICKENRDWYNQICEFFERKLKRKNNLSELDDGCYKTLILYIDECYRTEKYFKGKKGTDITEQDITRVYDGLEDGKILPNGDRRKYYNNFLKSKPFDLIGKKEIAKKVIEYTNKQDEEVRFFSPETYSNIFKEIISLEHRTSSQLAWDITENMTSILKLKKKNCKRKINEDGNPEYHIILPKEILKRSRTQRTEITFYPETVQLLDKLIARGKFVKNILTHNIHGRITSSKPIYAPYEDDDTLFSFGQRQAQMFWKRACIKANATLEDKHDIPLIKDIRSSSACNYLDLGLSSDEIKSRLGHKPSSRVLDKYVTYKALDKTRPKKRIVESSIQELELKLKKSSEISEIQKREIDKLKAKDEIRNRLMFIIAKQKQDTSDKKEMEVLMKQLILS